MVVIGLTGGVGTGKSTVAGMFRELGAVVLDADRIAHALMRPGTAVHRKIKARFGRGIVAAGGRIDRRKLADRVFEDRSALGTLCRIIHPAVRRRILAQLQAVRRYRPKAVAVLDIPLLLETEFPYPTQAVVVVAASRRVVERRLESRSGWSPAELARRGRFQMPLREKVRRADFVVDNGGSKVETRREVRRIWRKLTGEGDDGRRKGN